MGSTHDWPVPQNAPDWVGRTEKRLGALERRDGPVSQVLQIVGPGQNKQALLIGDWNDPMAANNGYFWSKPGALHAPDGVRVWTGSVVARTDNSGMQQVWNTDDLDDVRYYMRTFIDDTTGPEGKLQGRTFSEWRQFATPTGFIELDNFGDTVNDLLADMAAEIDNAAQALLFYEQDDEPVPGVSGVPLAADIPVGSVWVDTDDNRHTYSWDGTDWVSVESTLFGDIAAELLVLTDAVEAAATAASDAMDFAEQLTIAYRQATPPSNPDSNGRALVADDVWFDSDDGNRMYTWSGAAWVDLGIATEDYVDNAAEVIADFAATLNKTYRQSSAPTDPDVDGRTLVAQDTWFDTSTSLNEMKRWSGLAWVSADVGFTDADLATPTVTGGILQTIATAARGVKITSAGLTAYNGSGVATLVVDAATGGITMSGNVSTGGTIDGAVVTGGTLQSEATAARGIKINSTALIAYNSSGVAQFTITASTGAVTLAGALTGGGTITGPTFQTSASANTGIKISSSGLLGYNGTIAKFSLNASTGVLTLDGGVFTAGTIDGAVVTGGTLQTEATASRGIKFNSSGMTVYDGSGGSVMTIVASTGAVTINGALAAIAVTGATVTGGILQTTATASRGVKITSTGMIAYDNSGVTQVTLDATTGVLTVAGGVLTGGSLTGGVVTGGTLQSEATAGRGFKINSSGAVLYAPSPTTAGTAVFTLDATTGSVVLAGSMTGGGTITGPVFQTASSGERVVVRNDGGGGIIEFFSGLATETAGSVNPSTVDVGGGTFVPAIEMSPGTVTGYGRVPIFRLIPSAGAAAGGGGVIIGLADSYLIAAGAGSVSHIVMDAAGYLLQANIAQGPGHDYWRASCSSNATATTTTNVTINGLSTTISNVPGTGATYLVTIDAAWATAAGTSSIIELLVDGTAQTVQMTQSTAVLDSLSASKTWDISGLSAGSHTFTARVRNTAIGTTAVVAATNTVMTIRRHG